MAGMFCKLIRLSTCLCKRSFQWRIVVTLVIGKPKFLNILILKNITKTLLVAFSSFTGRFPQASTALWPIKMALASAIFQGFQSAPYEAFSRCF
jgi:hypothetical protein